MNGVILEVEFKEVGNEQYTKFLIGALKDRFGKELTKEQMNILSDTIEQARLNAMNPVDLAENLNENWKVIFPK